MRATATSSTMVLAPEAARSETCLLVLVIVEVIVVLCGVVVIYDGELGYVVADSPVMVTTGAGQPVGTPVTLVLGGEGPWDRREAGSPCYFQLYSVELAAHFEL